MQSSSPSGIDRRRARRFWESLCARDRRADGRFVYGVRTTGVFCRPSCASRRPKRENVEFFGDGAAALAAGYRPCRRCRPTEADPRRLRDRALVDACRLLSADTARSGAEIARAVGLSRYHFQRRFKATFGVTPRQFRRRVVAERAKHALADARTVTDAIFAAGYASGSRFYAGAARELGMRASRALRRGEGERVRYAVRGCSLGRIAVAWTERGVCDVRFGRTDAELARALDVRFGAAELARSRVPEWVSAVVRRVERPESASIPLDLRGTAFQERVWRALCEIPAGTTRTYGELARALGAPNASRAVGRACADNTLAVVVPCHRVVPASGGLGGYRWGVSRKRALLDREAIIREPAPSRRAR